MPDNTPGTLETITIELTKLVRPLKERVEQGEILELFAELGIQFPNSLAADPTFQTAVTDVVNKIGQMPSKVTAMINALNASPAQYDVAAQSAIELVEIIAALITDFETITTAVTNHGPYPGVTSGDIGALAKNLFDYLIVNYIDTSVPIFAAFLEFFGIIEEEEVPVQLASPPENVIRKTLHLDRLPTLITNPAALALELYGWGGGPLTLNGSSQIKLFKKLEKLFNKFGWPAVYDNTTVPHHLDLLLATLRIYTSGSPNQGVQLAFDQPVGSSFTRTFAEDKWTLVATVAASITPNVGVSWVPDEGLDTQILNGSPPVVNGAVSVKWTAIDNLTSQPLILFGETGGSRLEAKEISAFLGTTFSAPVGAGTASGTITFEAEIKDGKLVVKPGDPDGFLAKILPPEGFTLDFSMLVGISSQKGLYFKASGTLEVDLPINLNLGPISIPNLTVGLSIGDQLALNLGADIKAELGPFTAIVENMGIKLLLLFPEDRNGNLGVANLGIGFKPPRGIGMSIDTSVVKGGGYLMIDSENGRYAGALELEFKGLFGFTAIAIINTKFPDGSEGFSLLLLVNVTFGTPIVLGYNFYLAGVGGIIGLHRSMNTEKIRDGVRDGSISNILFPENVIANITQIISDLETIFPAKQDQFFLGLMARITWSVPALLTIEAGLAVEFPNPVKIALLGIIRCVLPTADAAVIRLNVAFAGIIDFEKKLLSFDASIFDSRILTITLEGDMALRVCWGDQPDFLVSIGGFHPSYTVAPHLELKPIKRLTVNILSGNPNLVLTAYFAITTNTIQFGAQLDFSFRVSEFGIYGNFGFDVLIQFSPFRFIANVRASVAVKLGSSTLFSIQLDFNLEGPTPWHAYGYASFTILFFTIKVRFDKAWGEEQTNSLPATEVLEKLREELEKDTNWEAKSLPQIIELVTLGPAAADPDAVLVRGTGSLEVNQTVVPLDTTLEHFGNYRPVDINKATITKLRVNTTDYSDAELADLKNSFAPAAYKNLADGDKLKAPSYEKMNSGVRLNGTDNISFDYGINRIVEYDVILSDYEQEVVWGRDNRLSFGMNYFRPFISGGDVGKSFLSKAKKSALETTDKFVSVSDEQFVVTSVKTMQNVHESAMVFDSRSAADEYFRQTIAADPKKKGKIQISPAFQMA
jgi:hypothetical protein